MTDSFYMRPSIAAETIGHIENYLFEDLLKHSVVEFPELFTPTYFNTINTSFCDFVKDFKEYINTPRPTSWILALLYNTDLYSVLIATYVSGQGFYINYLCRNESIDESRGYGKKILEKFISSVKNITGKGYTIKIYLADAADKPGYYQRIGFGPEADDGNTSLYTVSKGEIPGNKLKRQSTHKVPKKNNISKSTHDDSAPLVKKSKVDTINTGGNSNATRITKQTRKTNKRKTNKRKTNKRKK